MLLLRSDVLDRQVLIGMILIGAWWSILGVGRAEWRL